MATPSMRTPRLTTPLIGLVFVSCAFLSTSSFLLAQEELEVFQPVLTGFRCEGYNEVTSDGVLIIEADSSVKITLFGEYFTTETIVGFTTEFVSHIDVVDQMITKNESNSSKPAAARGATTTKREDNENRGRQVEQTELSTPNARSASLESIREVRGEHDSSTNQTKVRGSNFTEPLEQNPSRSTDITPRSVPSPPPTLADQRPYQANSEAEAKQRRQRRRLLNGNSYDCTDFDRVISYKLAEENIITPNVAVLTIKLPELGTLSSSGSYYYFCLKQPPKPGEALLRYEAAENAAASQLSEEQSTNSTGSTTALFLAPPQAISGRANSFETNWTRHVWVHQGNEWWLMIRVEPPILSITNDCILIILLLLLSAVTSGLNLGLMSLDMNELAVISSCGDQRERSYARAIAPLRKRGNYLLCSLLLGNVMVNSTLTVILEEMTSGVVAVIGSTLAIVVLGEIVPQAFCARQGLAIGAKTIYLTYAFMILTFPLSYPISCLLDCVLGAEKGHVYDRERLMEFIRITGNHSQLEADEVAIIAGALKLKKIKVDQIMTKLEDVFMLPIECMLDRKTIRSIIEKGYSRIPVYEFGDRRQIVALILAKDLALLDPDDQMPLASMLMYCKHPLLFIEDTATLDVALNEFKTGKSHLAIVRQIFDDGEVDKYYEAIGVVTLEDVIEEVLQQEINDETDTLSDNRRKRRRTDAQVAHLVDEFITDSPKKPPLLAPTSPNTNLDMMNLNKTSSINQNPNNF